MLNETKVTFQTLVTNWIKENYAVDEIEIISYEIINYFPELSRTILITGFHYGYIKTDSVKITFKLNDYIFMATDPECFSKLKQILDMIVQYRKKWWQEVIDEDEEIYRDEISKISNGYPT